MIELTPADVIRLRALGVQAEPAVGPLSRDDEIIIALNERCATYHKALLLSVESERRALRAAARWRAWGWTGLACAALSVAAQIIAAAARVGGW